MLARRSIFLPPTHCLRSCCVAESGKLLRERSMHVWGHEIGVSWEAISLLTPRARGWPFTPPSIYCVNPSPLLDCNRSNYYSLLVTVAEPERREGKKRMPFFSLAAIMYGADEVRKLENEKRPSLGGCHTEGAGFKESWVSVESCWFHYQANKTQSS